MAAIFSDNQIKLRKYSHSHTPISPVQIVKKFDSTFCSTNNVIVTVFASTAKSKNTLSKPSSENIFFCYQVLTGITILVAFSLSLYQKVDKVLLRPRRKSCNVFFQVYLMKFPPIRKISFQFSCVFLFEFHSFY